MFKVLNVGKCLFYPLNLNSGVLQRVGVGEVGLVAGSSRYLA